MSDITADDRLTADDINAYLPSIATGDDGGTTTSWGRST